MQAFLSHTGTVVPLMRDNIDTDQIIPKQFLKRVERSGYGEYLFYDWRFNEDGRPDPDFALNRLEYQQATVLVTGRNFGCGSSREHAAWAIRDRGFRVVVAPSFADIFYNNATKNGVLPVVLQEDEIAELLKSTNRDEVTVNLESQSVSCDSGWAARFEMDAFRRECLLQGLDEIGATLQVEAAITAFERSLPQWQPSHRG